MEQGHFYFIKDEFYERFKNYGLSTNKETVNGIHHQRPCCYLFKYGGEYDDIYWMIPISSKIKKYEKEYQRSIEKYGMCDNISFGYILGNRAAFLIQNAFPVTSEHIMNEYIDINTDKPVTISKRLCSELNAKARKKIRLGQRGIKLGMTDTAKMLDELLGNRNEYRNPKI